MTDKEQIIIDGCNVLKCRYYQYKTLKDCEMRYPESGDCEIGLINYLFNGNLDMEKLCVDNPNCYFKQLARKTQECEVLKFKIHDLRQLRELDREARVRFYNQACEYRKALEEIEKATKINCEEICGRKFEDCNDFLCSSKNILDIINKAKGEE